MLVTAKDISDKKGVGIRAVQRLAIRKGWTVVARDGKACFYDLAELPADIQSAFGFQVSPQDPQYLPGAFSTSAAPQIRGSSVHNGSDSLHKEGPAHTSSEHSEDFAPELLIADPLIKGLDTQPTAPQVLLQVLHGSPEAFSTQPPIRLEREWEPITDPAEIDRQRYKARLEVVAAWDRWWSDNQETWKGRMVPAKEHWCDLFGKHLVLNGAEDQWIRHYVKKCKRASLDNWRLNREQLLGKPGRVLGQSIENNQEIKELLIAFKEQYPFASLNLAVEALMLRFPKETLPSDSTVRRWMREWTEDPANQRRLAAIQNPGEWKNKFMPAFGQRTTTEFYPNARWELDSTPADVMCSDGRHYLLGVIDTWTRRKRLLVSKTSRAAAVLGLLRQTLTDGFPGVNNDHGFVPDLVVTDNGRDYASHAVRDGLARLGVEHKLCRPHRPWEKPFIERSFKSFSHDLVPLMDSFIGHNVGQRKAIENRWGFAQSLFARNGVVEIGLTGEELQAWCDDWCKGYNTRPHEGEDMAGMSPFQKFQSSTTALKRLPVEQRQALTVLLAEARWVTVNKDGGIRFQNGEYIHSDLGNRVAEKLEARLDPLDLGRLYLFDAAGGFVCVAEDPNRTGVDRQLIATLARKKGEEEAKRARAEAKARAKRADIDDLAQEIQAARVEVADKLAALPKQETHYSTPALEAATEAVAALSLVPRVLNSTPLTEEQIRMADAYWAEQKPIVVDVDNFFDLLNREFETLSDHEKVGIARFARFGGVDEDVLNSWQLVTMRACLDWQESKTLAS